MKVSLQLKLSQSLTMTPQLQQAIRLLQLSSMELETEIQEALDSNMMLELDDEPGQQASAEEDNNDSLPAPESADIADPGDTTAELHASETETGLNNDNIPTDLPVDSAWEDIYDSPTSYSKPLTGND